MLSDVFWATLVLSLLYLLLARFNASINFSVYSKPLINIKGIVSQFNRSIDCDFIGNIFERICHTRGFNIASTHNSNGIRLSYGGDGGGGVEMAVSIHYFTFIQIALNYRFG